MQDLEENLLKKLNQLICKCHAKLLQQQQEEMAKVQGELQGLQVEESKGEGAGVKQVKLDNLYDVLFTSSGQQKTNTHKKLKITGEKLDFLES